MTNNTIIFDFLDLMFLHDDDYLLTNILMLDEYSEAQVFSNNPSEVFNAQYSNILIVNSRAVCYGTIDRCELGCWRIIGREKLIKCENTGKVLGFKKILKFCEENKPRENDISWVMEEYSFKRTRDKAICKIMLMNEAEISLLIYKHFSRNYYKSSDDQQEKDESYLEMLIDFYENYWSRDWNINNEVYQVDPLKLVDHQDVNILENGMCIVAKRAEIYGKPKPDEFEVGYWRILDRNGTIKSNTGVIIGFKRVLRFYEIEKRIILCGGEDIEGSNWIMEEYRLSDIITQENVLCVIKLMSPYSLNRLLKS